MNMTVCISVCIGNMENFIFPHDGLHHSRHLFLVLNGVDSFQTELQATITALASGDAVKFRINVIITLTMLFRQEFDFVIGNFLHHLHLPTPPTPTTPIHSSHPIHPSYTSYSSYSTNTLLLRLLTLPTPPIYPYYPSYSTNPLLLPLLTLPTPPTPTTPTTPTQYSYTILLHNTPTKNLSRYPVTKNNLSTLSRYPKHTPSYTIIKTIHYGIYIF